jgi:hypothetical protein
MRKGGTEAASGFFKCRGIKRALSCKSQIVDQLRAVSERSRLEKMVRDLSGALLDGSGI